ncbi:hypothetical protein BDB01DRAFT_741193 [Pilobolus umbonatus]|nr:hypothetical protein BDB01DRAFT_741193 [Pilobolus umbonatus]
MLSTVLISACKQNKKNCCSLKEVGTSHSYLYLLFEHPLSRQKRRITNFNKPFRPPKTSIQYNNATATRMRIIQSRTPNTVASTRLLSSTHEPEDTTVNKKTEEGDSVLSAALGQSNAAVAQSLLDTTYKLLRMGRSMDAWDCYKDLTSRNIQKYISRDQYGHLIKSFNHATNHKLGLEYVLTIVEDMKQLGYQTGRKEKMVVLRLLGRNGNIQAMEQIFDDLVNTLPVSITHEITVIKPFNIMLTTYQEQASKIGQQPLADKSMEVFGKLLDLNIKPASSTNRLFIENIRMAGNSVEVVEKVWSWVWGKIGMHLSGKGHELDESLYNDMVIYFTSTGRPEYALEINDIMQKKNIARHVRTMTALIHKVGRMGNLQRSEEIFEELLNMRNLGPNIVTFNALIDVHAHRKPEPDFTGASRIYNMMIEMGFPPDVTTFGTLIDMFAKKGDISMINVLYKDMIRNHDIKPSAYIFSSIIEAFLRAKDHGSAMKVFHLLQDKVPYGVKPNRVTYNILFKELIKAGYVKESLSFLKDMMKNGIKPEPRTFNPLLSYFASNGDSKATFDVATMMNNADVTLDRFAYAILLESYAKNGDMSGAEEIFEMYKHKGPPNIYMYSSLLYVYSRNNELDKVLETYKRMSKGFVKANQYTYGILMHFYSRRKEIAAVEAIMETIRVNNIDPGVTCWTILMQTYFEANRLEDAKNVMNQIIQAGLEPSDHTLGIFMKGCIENGNIELADSVLQETIKNSQETMVNDYELLSNLNFKSETAYSTSLPVTVEDLLEDKKNLSAKKQLSPYLFGTMLDAYIQTSNFSKAKELYKQMQNLSIEMTLPIYTTLMVLCKGESRHDTVEAMWKALHAYNPEQSTKEIIDPELGTIPLPNPISVYDNLLILDDDDNANKPVVRIQSSNFALSIYLDMLQDKNRFNDIQNVWDDLTKEGYKFDESNWNRYITALLIMGDTSKACLLVHDRLLTANGDDKEEIFGPATKRSRDDFYLSNDTHLHYRTCLAFGMALDIRGAENMGELRLRMAVKESIKEFVKTNPS